jgi:hypothetical protein
MIDTGGLAANRYASNPRPSKVTTSRIKTFRDRHKSSCDYGSSESAEGTENGGSKIV